MFFKIIFPVAILISILLNYSCTTVNNGVSTKEFNEIDSLYLLVGEKHDTAMLLMKDISQLQFKLRNKLANENNHEKENILNLLSELNSADDAMMNWMRNFKGKELEEDFYLQTDENEIMSYLKNEEIKIESVHSEMLISIDNARKYLK